MFCVMFKIKQRKIKMNNFDVSMVSATEGVSYVRCAMN